MTGGDKKRRKKEVIADAEVRWTVSSDSGLCQVSEF